jgi:hypothetical protein
MTPFKFSSKNLTEGTDLHLKSSHIIRLPQLVPHWRESPSHVRQRTRVHAIHPVVTGIRLDAAK